MKESEKLTLGENLIFEGMTSIRAVIAAIESGESDRTILNLYVAESRVAARLKELSYLKAMSYKYSFQVKTVPDIEVDAIAIGNNHGGLLLETTKRTIPPLTAEAIEAVPENERYFVMIEGIEDPYNFGYALRSLYASGVSAVILSPRNWMSAAGIVCRASAGASEAVKTYVADSVSDCIAIMRSHGVKIVSADMKNSMPIYDADLKKPLFLAIGGERRGLSKELLTNSDVIVRLEYGRDFPAALSAASAASIAGFEVLRQNQTR